jgi:hypothetical protein
VDGSALTLDQWTWSNLDNGEVTLLIGSHSMARKAEQDVDPRLAAETTGSA